MHTLMSKQLPIIMLCTPCCIVQAVRRLGGVKSQSASERWKKKQKKEEEPTKVHTSVVMLNIAWILEFTTQEQSTVEDKQLLERLTGLADQLVAIGDYSILTYSLT